MYNENSLPEICSLAVLRRFIIVNIPFSKYEPSLFACFNSRLIQNDFGGKDGEQSRAYAHLLHIYVTLSAVESCASTMYM